MSIHLRHLAGAAAAGLVALAPSAVPNVSAARATAATGDPIKIGVTVDQTQNLITYDAALLAGATLAVDDVNARGGIDGRPLELVVQDMANDPQQAIQAFEYLNTREDVFTFIAGASSQGGAALDPLLTEAGKVAVTDTTLAEDTQSMYSYSFNQYLVGDLLAEHLGAHDLARVALLRDGTPYNDFVQSVLEDVLPEAGIEIVATAEHSSDVADLRAQVESMLDADPDAILKISAGASDIVAAKALAQAGATVPMIGTTSATPTAVQTAAEYDHYFFLAWPVQLVGSLADPSETLQQFVSVFDDPDVDAGYASVGWDIVQHLALALRSMDELDPGLVGDAIEALEPYDGAAASYDFSGGPGSGVTVAPYRVAHIDSGEVVEAP